MNFSLSLKLATNSGSNSLSISSLESVFFNSLTTWKNNPSINNFVLVFLVHIFYVENPCAKTSTIKSSVSIKLCQSLAIQQSLENLAVLRLTCFFVWINIFHRHNSYTEIATVSAVAFLFLV